MKFLTKISTKNILDRAAAIILFCIVLIMLGYFVAQLINSFRSKEKVHINFVLGNVQVKKVDSGLLVLNQKFITDFNLKSDTLKMKIEELYKVKNDIEEAQRKSDDYTKLIFALVGSVFVIVGFFGFKSMYDTRQIALETAKNSAEKIADRTVQQKLPELLNEQINTYLNNSGKILLSELATKIVTDIAYKVSTDVSENTSKEEASRYFASVNANSESLNELIRLVDQDSMGLRSRIGKIEDIIYGNSKFVSEDELGNSKMSTSQPASGTESTPINLPVV